MKIKDVKIQIIERNYNLGNNANLSFGELSFLDKLGIVPILTIITDTGIQGNSFGFSGKKVAPYLDFLKPLLLGKNPLFREELWQKLRAEIRHGFIPSMVQGMIDVALWDIAGKAAGMPIYKMLGAYREKVRVYSSLPVIPTPEDTVKAVIIYKNMGITASKLHVPGIADTDIEICKAVRKAVGDKYTLMLDPAGAYNHDEALKVGREIEKLNFEWYEEPISDMDITGLTQLCRDLDIPIAYQSYHPNNFYTMAHRIKNEAIDIIRADALFGDGISALKKTATLAEAFGMRCEMLTQFDPIMNSASLNVMCSVKNCKFFEYLTINHVLDYGVKQPLLIDKEGYIHVPKGPGLGMEIDWDFINKNTILSL